MQQNRSEAERVKRELDGERRDLRDWEESLKGRKGELEREKEALEGESRYCCTLCAGRVHCASSVQRGVRAETWGRVPLRNVGSAHRHFASSERKGPTVGIPEGAKVDELGCWWEARQRYLAHVLEYYSQPPVAYTHKSHPPLSLSQIMR